MNYPRLRDLREDKDLKQKDIAKILNTSPNYYGDYENGKRPIPFERVIELANYYNVSLDYIAGRTNDKKGLTKSSLADDETMLIKKFRMLNNTRKGKIIERLDILVEEQENEIAFKQDAI